MAVAKEDAQSELVFKAPDNTARRLILDTLGQTLRTTGALYESLTRLDRTTVLQHLRVLEKHAWSG